MGDVWLWTAEHSIAKGAQATHPTKSINMQWQRQPQAASESSQRAHQVFVPPPEVERSTQSSGMVNKPNGLKLK